MSDSEIRIFYSWQSDLPGNETRNLIQDGIKEAVKLLRDTVDVEADRDTKGKTGSPDIAHTIFSKIDECDIFIADVTAISQIEVVGKNGEKEIKSIPNPNVMLELGYATKVLGWENVICVLNTDYGSIKNMPFDISSRRLTPFSLNGSTKGDVKRYIRDVIRETVEILLENGKRVKAGFTDLRIGCLDGNNKISTNLTPVKLSESDKYLSIKKERISKCKSLFKKLKAIDIPEEDLKVIEEEVNHNSSNDKESNLARLAATLNGKAVKICINDEDREQIKNYLKKYTDIEIDTNDNLFNFGGLKKKSDLWNHYSLEGTDDEKQKYDYYEKLYYEFVMLEIEERYVSTFDDYLFLPLAIENKSNKCDNNIDISVKFNPEQVEVIYPSRKLICQNLEGAEEIIIDAELPKTLLMMEDSSVISYDEDISFSIMDSQAKIRAQFNVGGINGNPRYTSEDYERELRKYIAMPSQGQKNEFLYTIDSLRAAEKKWLGAAILFKPLVDNIELSYSIKSNQSDGYLGDILVYNKAE